MAVTELRATSEARLRELEESIDKGLGTFIEVGRALQEIAEFKLYLLAGFKSFPEYTEQRWDLSRNAAYRKVYAVRVVDALGEAKTPVNETQANALAPLLREPERLRSVWESVTEKEERVSAKQVRSAVNVLLGQKPKAPQGRPPRMVECPKCHHEFLARDHEAKPGVKAVAD